MKRFETEVDDTDETDSDNDAEAETTPTSVGVIDPNRIANLARQERSLADDQLIAVYGDTVHRNYGHDLHGDMDGDAAMQMLYDKIVDHPNPMWSPSKGKVGDRFILLFAKELSQVRSRLYNSERTLLLPACILQRVKWSFCRKDNQETTDKEDGSVGGGDDSGAGIGNSCVGKERGRQRKAIHGQ